MHLHTLVLTLALTAAKPTPAPPVVAAPPAAARDELATRLALYERYTAPSADDKEAIGPVDSRAAAFEQLELALKINELTADEKLTILDLTVKNRLGVPACIDVLMANQGRAGFGSDITTAVRWCIGAIEPHVAAMVAIDPRSPKTLENQLRLATIYGQSPTSKDKLREVLKAVTEADPAGFLGDVAARRLKLVR